MLPGPQFDRREWLRSSAVGLAALALARGSSGADVPSGPGTNATGAGLRARLSLNENPYGPSPKAIDAMVAAVGGVNRYAGDDAQSLIAQIAQREGVPAGQIVLGQVEAPLGLHLGLGKGEFLYAVPGYTDLVGAAVETGGTAVAVPLNARLEHDLDAFASRVGPRTAAVFIVNPHNPSGTMVDPSALERFVKGVPESTWVVIDEAYLDFTDDFQARTAVRHVRDGLNVVVLRTFGKLFAMPGLQIGYAVIPQQFVSAIGRFGLGSTLALNRLSIAAASASLADPGYPAAISARIRRERDRYVSALRDLRLRHSDSSGNFVYFDSGRPHAEVAEAFLRRGVEVARVFPPFDSWVRISVGLPQENTLALQALREILG
jgi:histidinol-phosphate aminotransferase